MRFRVHFESLTTLFNDRMHYDENIQTEILSEISTSVDVP